TVERSGNDFEKVAARNDHALVDVEAMFAEPCFSREISCGHAIEHATAQHRLDVAPFAGREGLLQHAGIALQRHPKRAKQQVERLVMRIRRDLTERDTTADRKSVV